MNGERLDERARGGFYYENILHYFLSPERIISPAIKLDLCLESQELTDNPYYNLKRLSARFQVKSFFLISHDNSDNFLHCPYCSNPKVTDIKKTQFM